MTKNGIFFHWPSRGDGRCYLIPTLFFWRTDFREVDPSWTLSYGICFGFLFWEMAIIIHMYGNNGKKS
jgi:hypothetical protein